MRNTTTKQTSKQANKQTSKQAKNNLKTEAIEQRKLDAFSGELAKNITSKTSSADLSISMNQN